MVDSADVNFEIHLCSSDMNSDCIWRWISIQFVQIERSELWPRKWILLGWNLWRKACRSTWIWSTCRSMQVKIYTGLIASTDLLPQEMFTFSEMLALVVSESSFGAYVCHRRPAGLHRDQRSCQVSPWSLWGAEQMSTCGSLCASWQKYLYRHHVCNFPKGIF